MIPTLENEIWKDFIDYPDLFSISNLGRIFSKRTNKILKTLINPEGYEAFLLG